MLCGWAERGNFEASKWSEMGLMTGPNLTGCRCNFTGDFIFLVFERSTGRNCRGGCRRGFLLCVRVRKSVKLLPQATALYYSGSVVILRQLSLSLSPPPPTFFGRSNRRHQAERAERATAHLSLSLSQTEWFSESEKRRKRNRRVRVSWFPASPPIFHRDVITEPTHAGAAVSVSHTVPAGADFFRVSFSLTLSI